MILPEDTKAPIPSDDEFEYQDEYEYEEEYSPYDYDFDSSSPRETRPFVPYTDDPEPYPFDNTGADVNAASADAGRGDELPYPASPRSTLTHPLLADVSDIELGLGLGPAPPYTPRDENPRSRAAVRAARTRAEEAKGKMSRKARLWRMAWKGVVVYLALMGVMTITWRMFGPGRRGPGWDGPHPPPPHSDDGSSGPGRPEQDGGKGSGGGGGGGWEDHEHDHRPDGVPLECISWDASSYSAFPIASSQPHLPAPLDPEVGSRRSTNRTILLPLDGRELFAHLVGSSAIGNFFLSTYDPSDSTTWKQDSEGAITPSEDEEVEIGQGKYLRVVVEAVYDVLPGLEGPADEETSPGWEALLASKVCLMSRNRTLVDSPSSSDSDPEPSSSSASLSRRNRKDGATPPFLLPGMGLNAYTRRPASSPHEWRNPLSFRIHVALPTNTPPSLAASILSALLPLEPPGFGGHPRPNSVRSLDLRGGAMGVYADLDRAAVGKLGINSALGEIVLEKTRAEVISIEGNGEVRGDVAISNALEVKTPIGEINLNITLARPPPEPSPKPPSPWSSWFRPPDAPGKTLDICSLPPVIVDIFAASESSTLRFVDWEETCRGLRLDVVSLIGDVTILGHPAFEGPVTIHSTLGTIDVLSPEVEDPEGKGRWRNVTMEKNDRLGNKFWSGEVKWEEAEQGGDSEAASGSVETKTETAAETRIENETDANLARPSSPQRRSEPEQAEWNHLSEQSVLPPPPKGHGRQRPTKGMDVRTSVGSVRIEL